MTDKRTPEQVELDSALTALHSDCIVPALKDRGVEAYRYKDGVKVIATVWPDRSIYVYALPWARGWRLFVSDRGDDTLETQSTVKTQFRYMQSTVYATRGRTGPYTCDTDAIINKLDAYVTVLRSWDRAKQAAARRKVWYWPRAALSHGAAAEGSL